jgi:hypothetical protein
MTFEQPLNGHALARPSSRRAARGVGGYVVCHGLVRTVELGKEIVGVDELATVGLSDGLEQQTFLFRRNAAPSEKG